ncbi:MAG: ATP-binding protein [Dehalococcoidia bacterium]
MAPLIHLPDYLRPVTTQVDVEAVCRLTLDYARACDLSDLAAAELRLICSELATNLLDHAGGGTLSLAIAAERDRRGVRIEAVDAGPGIVDVDLAMTEGYSTSGGLGQGLPLVRRLASTFEIASTPQGTRVVATKWA